MTSTYGSKMYGSVNITFSNFQQSQQDCLFYKSAQQSFYYSCFLGLLASVTDGSWTWVVSQSVNVYSESLVAGRVGEI